MPPGLALMAEQVQNKERLRWAFSENGCDLNKVPVEASLARAEDS